MSVPVFLKGGDGGQCDTDGCIGQWYIRRLRGSFLRKRRRWGQGLLRDIATERPAPHTSDSSNTDKIGGTC